MLGWVRLGSVHPPSHRRLPLPLRYPMFQRVFTRALFLKRNSVSSRESPFRPKESLEEKDGDEVKDSQPPAPPEDEEGDVSILVNDLPHIDELTRRGASRS